MTHFTISENIPVALKLLKKNSCTPSSFSPPRVVNLSLLSLASVWVRSNCKFISR